LREILTNTLWDVAKHYRQKKCDVRLERTLGQTLDAYSERMSRNFAVAIAPRQNSPSQQLMRGERVRLLAEAIESLPESQHMAIDLHHLQGYSLLETAQFMERSAVSVAGLLRRGLETMRGRLKESEPELR